MKAPRYVDKPIIYQPAGRSNMPEGTNLKKGSQYTYNVTLRRVRIAIVAVEKQ